jgi:hypothetical protein
VEFAYNNARHSSTSQSPFLTSYGCHPSSLLDSTLGSILNSSSFAISSSVPDARKLAVRLVEAHDVARKSLAVAAGRMSRYADPHRSSPPSFEVGDMVLIKSHNIRTTRPSKKLDDKNIGPFRVTHSLGSHNYRLDLGTLTNNVFHVDQMSHYFSPSSFSGRPRLARPPPDISDPDAYEMSEIVDSRLLRRKLKYLVRWVGYGNEDMTWVPHTGFHHNDSLVLDFIRKQPDKPSLSATRLAIADAGEGSSVTVMGPPCQNATQVKSRQHRAPN